MSEAGFDKLTKAFEECGYYLLNLQINSHLEFSGNLRIIDKAKEIIDNEK